MILSGGTLTRQVPAAGLQFVPFGLSHSEDIVALREPKLHAGVAFVESEIDRVVIVANEVHLTSGATLTYDVLVLAIRAEPNPSQNWFFTREPCSIGSNASLRCSSRCVMQRQPNPTLNRSGGRSVTGAQRTCANLPAS